MFKQKLKRVKAALSRWSRESGDIFKRLSILEDIVRVKEILFEEEPTIENRIVLQKAQSELKKYLSIEEQYWKEKAGMTWFDEGDMNTSFFHNHVNGKRKKLQLKRINNGSGVWIEDQEQLATAAMDFYKNQFTTEGDASDFSLLNNIPSMVTMDENLELSRMPTLEVRDAVFELSGESASGPDGFTGLFYHSCWDVIGANTHNMVLHFYGGVALPKSITHTNLVLLPKKPRVETFSDLRPISLSHFINKVFSRVLHDILEGFLPSLISPNQFRFVKGRSIFENILLTQEIVTDTRLRGKPANVVIKLDMAKAYDSVSWKYLLHVLRKMGFSEHFIIMVWNLVSINWYSLLVNGQALGFFKSTRGVKQGDPLSPALFILSAEVLSGSLNKLFEHKSFMGFGMPKWSDPLNHLAYADKTIIFASAHPPSLSKIMAVLGSYERISGQMINKDKSSYYMHSKVANGLFQAVGAITGFARVLDPPNNILENLHKIFARFFWSTKEEGWSRHWASWQNLCLPKEEGGLGFRSLHDVSRALFAKLWWRFRTTKSLWSNFMWNKYCKKELPTVVQFREGSHVWRQMLNAREEVEHEILWELKSGTTNIWHKNWTGLGALYHVLPEDFPINEDLQEVAELRHGEAWDDQLLDQTINEDIAEHIRSNVHYEGSEEYWDKPYWMPTSSAEANHKALVECTMLSQAEATVQAIPAIITWELWKRRNAGKHGGSVSTNRLPFHGWYKCNTDGASKGNPGPSSLGFYVRNDEGDVVYARAVDLGVTTNVVAKAKAILQGLEYCMEHDLHPLILETDSLVMKKVIEGEWDPPWVIAPDVKRIKELKGNFNVIFQHVFREGNSVADFIANIVFSFASTSEFHSFSKLPSAGRRLINLDKSQTPNLRVPVVLAWSHAHSGGALIVYRNNVISRYWMVQFILLLICSNVKEMAEFVMLHFWRLLNHFSVVLACFHAQSEDGLAMFRMMSTLKVWVEKDLSLKDHKITLLHKPGGARLKPNYTWLDPGVASLKPGFSLAKPA
ncbi:PREDICTED: uncharacterized protein LOC109226206 [Nicotiana attenuata]|uniref:uncharacterized protein LOC109226206 n=1 Tax=Nicotiana attenuata TaxID=49451 RepID=UPI00090553ED|nr:PREDICTED: uncharacterized protein LOC109226206 [Nicotiana attenuata]